jgi:hypothetical protein
MNPPDYSEIDAMLARSHRNLKIAGAILVFSVLVLVVNVWLFRPPVGRYQIDFHDMIRFDTATGRAWTGDGSFWQLVPEKEPVQKLTAVRPDYLKP